MCMPLKERKKARRNLPLKIFSIGKKLSIKQSKIYSTLLLLPILNPNG